MNTNAPLAELFGDKGVMERTTNLSPNTGFGTSDDACTRVRIADDEGPNWHLAFPALVDEEEQYRS